MSDLITTVGTGNNQSVTMYNFRGHNIRVKTIGNEPMFCLSDTCKALEIGNVSMCKSRLNQKGVSIADTLTAGGVQQMTFINESNLYKVIFQSRTKEAEEFTEWVTSEVLPAIRKTGGYIHATPEMSDDEIMAKALIVAQSTIDRKNAVIEEQKKQLELQAPDVEYCQEVLSASNLHATNSVAMHIGVSAMKLNKFLVDEDWIYKQGGIYYASCKIRGKGYADFHVIPYVNRDGETMTREHLKWTEKGRRAIIDLWNQKHTAAAR